MEIELYVHCPCYRPQEEQWVPEDPLLHLGALQNVHGHYISQCYCSFTRYWQARESLLYHCLYTVMTLLWLVVSLTCPLLLLKSFSLGDLCSFPQGWVLPVLQFVASFPAFSFLLVLLVCSFPSCFHSIWLSPESRPVVRSPNALDLIECL